MNSEKGQALPLALIALVVGMLAITPFLAHASSSLIGSGIYDQAMRERYSAEAGVEHAIWHLQYPRSEVPQGGELELPPFPINNKTVNVTIQNQDQAKRTYRITSRATSGDGSSTTIVACVLIPPYFNDGDFTRENNVTINRGVYATGNIRLRNNATINGGAYTTRDITLWNNATINGDVVAGGNINLGNNADIGGNVSAGGNLTLSNNVKITGNVYVSGNITLENNAEIIGDVRVGGDLTLKNNAVITGNVFIDGDITLKPNAQIKGNIYATGNITITFGSNSEIVGDVFATDNVTITPGQEHNVTGTIWENYSGVFPDPPECPGMPASHTLILSWVIIGQ